MPRQRKGKSKSKSKRNTYINDYQTVEENSLKRPDAQQLQELDQYVSELKGSASIDNSLIIYICIDILITLLEYFDSTPEYWFRSDDTLDVLVFGFFVFLLQCLGFIFLSYYTPYGFMTSFYHKGLTKDDIIEAYQSETKAKNILSKKHLTLYFAMGKCLLVLFDITFFPFRSPYFISCRLCNYILGTLCIAWLLFKNNYLSENFIAQQKIYLNYIISSVTYSDNSKLEWEGFSGYSYRLSVTFRGERRYLKYKGEKILSNRVIDYFCQSVRSNKKEIFISLFKTDCDVMLHNSFFSSEKEVSNIKNQFLLFLNHWHYRFINKKNIDKLVFDLSNLSGFAWYDSSDKENNTKAITFQLSSIDLSYLNSEQKQRFKETLKGIFLDEAEIDASTNRLVINFISCDPCKLIPSLNDEQKTKLRECVQTLPTYQIPKLSNSNHEVLEKNCIENQHYEQHDFFSAFPKLLKNLYSIFSDTHQPLKDNNDYTTSNSSQNSIDEAFEDVLKREGKVTLPLIYNKNQIGYIKLEEKTLQNLPNGGKHCLQLIRDTYNRNHWIKLSKKSQFSNKNGSAAFKLRLFDKNGGKVRGMLHQTDEEKMQTLPVYKFELLQKHL